MSIKTEESDKKFREWKAEIQKRCEEWLRNNPEHKPLTDPAKKSKIAVEVRASEVLTDTWFVILSGKVVGLFVGINAQSKAAKYASDLLNDGEVS